MRCGTSASSEVVDDYDCARIGMSPRENRAFALAEVPSTNRVRDRKRIDHGKPQSFFD